MVQEEFYVGLYSQLIKAIVDFFPYLEIDGWFKEIRRYDQRSIQLIGLDWVEVEMSYVCFPIYLGL